MAESAPRDIHLRAAVDEWWHESGFGRMNRPDRSGSASHVAAPSTPVEVPIPGFRELIRHEPSCSDAEGTRLDPASMITEYSPRFCFPAAFITSRAPDSNLGADLLALGWRERLRCRVARAHVFIRRRAHQLSDRTPRPKRVAGGLVDVQTDNFEPCCDSPRAQLLLGLAVRVTRVVPVEVDVQVLVE